MALNTEIFIETVEKYPLLYDTSHSEYKNKAKKNQLWSNIAEILGESDADTLKKQWKNLRDAYSKHLRSHRSRPGQATKLTERYKTWPWATLMSFLRPHLELAETHSDRQTNAEEAGSSIEANTSTPIIIAQPLSQHNDKPQHVRRRRKPRKRAFEQIQSQDEKIINFMSTTEEDDDTDYLLKSYAKKIKKMTDRRQATVKFDIAKIMLKAELEEADEMQSRLDAAQYLENNRSIVQPHASSAGPDTYDSVYVPSPLPVFENVDPLNTPPSNNVIKIKWE